MNETEACTETTFCSDVSMITNDITTSDDSVDNLMQSIDYAILQLTVRIEKKITRDVSYWRIGNVIDNSIFHIVGVSGLRPSLFHQLAYRWRFGDEKYAAFDARSK